MTSFYNYTGAVEYQQRQGSDMTDAIREALLASIEDGSWKVVPGTNRGDKKLWEGRVRSLAARLDVRASVTLTVPQGEVAFKAASKDGGTVAEPPKPATLAAATADDVRQWARKNRITVSPRGRLRADVLAAFTEATGRHVSS